MDYTLLHLSLTGMHIPARKLSSGTVASNWSIEFLINIGVSYNSMILSGFECKKEENTT